jgi:hypothetical protein
VPLLPLAVLAQGDPNPKPSATSIAQAGGLLPSARDTLSSPVRQQALSVGSGYRVGKWQLSCTLPDTSNVRVTLVEDRDPFLFLAVQGTYGPTILANQWKVKDARPDYATFAFYRECALHALGAVRAGVNTQPTYALPVYRAADCLAVGETARVMKDVDWAKIESALKAAYGSQYPASTNGLKNCLDPAHAQAVARPVMTGR